MVSPKAFTCVMFFFGGGGVVFFYHPTSPPRSPIRLVPCVPSYTLSKPVFKGVTHGMSSYLMRATASYLYEGFVGAAIS